jgi:hypothetical protein
MPASGTISPASHPPAMASGNARSAPLPLDAAAPIAHGARATTPQSSKKNRTNATLVSNVTRIESMLTRWPVKHANDFCKASELSTVVGDYLTSCGVKYY